MTREKERLKMIVKSKNAFPTHIPKKDGNYQLIAPTANVLTDEEYDAIKDVDSFVDGVKSGVFEVKGESKNVNDNQTDIFDDKKIESIDLEKVIESTLGATIIKMKPNDAIGVIKDVHVRAHLEDAYKIDKRPKVKKAIKAQLKTLDVKNEEEPAEKEELKDESIFLD